MLKKGLLSLCLMMCCIITSIANVSDQNTFETPDFNYPRDVDARAREVLDSALRIGDQNRVLQSVVQITMARGVISKNDISSSLALMDSVQTFLTPDYRSLLLMMKLKLFETIPSRYHDYDDDSQDPLQWGNKKVAGIKKDLSNQIIDPMGNGDRSVLHRPISQYQGILKMGNEWGQRCMPELYDFVMHSYLSNTYNKALVKEWRRYHAKDKDPFPSAYIIYEFGRKRISYEKADYIYNKYGKAEELAIFFHVKNPSRAVCVDFLKRYPNSVYRPLVESIKAKYDIQSVSFSYPQWASTSDSIHVGVNFVSGDTCFVNVYQLQESQLEASQLPKVPSFSVDQLKLVDRQQAIRNKKSKTEIALSPLPIGYYIIIPSVLTEEGEKQDMLLSAADMKSLHLRVSDFKTFFLITNQESRIYVVDVSTGAPIAGASVDYIRRVTQDGLSEWRSTRDTILDQKTDAEGCIRSEANILRYKVRKGADRDVFFSNGVGLSSGKKEEKKVEAFTDLDIYRPGDTVHVSAVLYDVTTTSKRVLPQVLLLLDLKDANDKQVASYSGFTDDFGQITTDFVLPTDRMNGTFRIEAYSIGTLNRQVVKRFTVSEYKLPNFYLDLSETPRFQRSGHRAVIKGKALTYSGMPLANTLVEGGLDPSYWGWFDDDDDYDDDMEFEVYTDAEGHFEYKCPRRWTNRRFSFFRRNRYWRRYDVSVECTDAAGETQEAETSVVIGIHNILRLEGGSFLIEEGKPVHLPIRLETTDKQVKDPQCRYVLYDKEGKKVRKGKFLSSEPDFDWADLPSGQYRLKAKLLGVKNARGFNKNINLYRLSDAMPPVESILWTPETLQTVDDQNIAHLSLGTSYDCYVYYVATDRMKEVASGWIHCQPGINKLDIQIPYLEGNFLTVQYFACYKGVQKSEKVVVSSPVKEKVTLQKVSFRDKITPGGHETWTFRFLKEDGSPVQGRMMLELYSKALEDMSSNAWDMSVSLLRPWLLNYTTPYLTRERYYPYKYRKNVDYKVEKLDVPSLNLFGMRYFTSFPGKPITTPTITAPMSLTRTEGDVRGMVVSASDDEPMIGVAVTEEGTTNGTITDADGCFTLNLIDKNATLVFSYVGYSTLYVKAVRNKSMRIELEEDSQQLEDVVVVGYGANRKSEVVGQLLTNVVPGVVVSNGIASLEDDDEKTVSPASRPTPKLKIRTGKTKVALWRPVVNAAADGTFTVDFDVCDENTTWCMQALAYTSNLVSDVLRADVLAQRELMVQPSLPRFLRTGDDVVLMANVQNASDSLQNVSAVVEIFDPRTGHVSVTETYQLTLAASATQAVSIACHVPVDAAFIGFRIKALSEQGSGDGEQQMIPVLPSISPVIETQPFFIAPSQTALTIDVPEVRTDSTSRLTFEYCDKPTWYCLQALPTLADNEASTSVGLAHSLYAVTLAAKVREVFSYDLSGAQTALNRNEDLKIGTLQDSPWLREAERQQKRLDALNLLLDKDYNAKQYNQLIEALQKFQLFDGGFVWVNDMTAHESSYWATGEVIELLGDMKVLGCLPADDRLKKMITSALYYMDNYIWIESIKDSTAVKRMCFVPYVFTRMLFVDDYPFRDVNCQKNAQEIIDGTIQAIVQDWKKMSLFQRPFVAMLLNRCGEHEVAVSILESLQQMAIHDPVLGMYWERHNDYWRDPVSYEATMLEAFAEIAPDDYRSCINEMRQWMLLQKRTDDWGGGSMAASAVRSLLLTGDDWLKAYDAEATEDKAEDLDFQILIDGQAADLSNVNTPMGYVRLEVPLSAQRIEIQRENELPAWGALYYQYAAPMQEIKEQSIPELSISKKLLIEGADGKWTELTPDASGRLLLHVGQHVKVSFTIHCDKNLEYVRLQDERAAFLEPVDQQSRYIWPYYMEVKDSKMNFFFYYLRKDTHFVSYECTVTNRGSFSSGIATIQSQNAPEYEAHSNGLKIVVE